MERYLDPSGVTRAKLGMLGSICPDLWTLGLVLKYVPFRISKFAFNTIVCSVLVCSYYMIRLGNLGFFLGQLEILIVALSKSTYQSQGSRVQLPVGA